jgi:carboxyl-terminal processing protease
MGPGMVALVALPMLLGFAGPDAASNRWGRVSRSGHRLWSNVSSAFAMPSAAAAEDEVGPYSAYQQALGILKKEYYAAPITPKKADDLTIAAIRGMLFSLNDPFTSYLDKTEWDSMQQTTRGDFEGIGAELEPYGQVIRVRRPIPDTPAWKIGLKKGDVVLRVGTYNGKGELVKTTSTKGLGINEVVKIIKGRAGTKVALWVMRKDVAKELHFVITRSFVEPPIVQYWMEDNQNKIGHIVLNEFNEKSDDQLDRAWTALEKQGMKALVFDLRYNPGGLLKVAVDVGSRFIESGPVVIIQEKNGQKQMMNVDGGQHNHKRIPLVVLVNENSASASEIVAGAIKDNAAGKLIGDHTFGKGLVQTLFPLNDGSALRLTTAKYFTSMGNDISNRYDDEHRPIFGTGGIKPDIEVTQSDDWADQDFDDKANDTQLKKALEYLRGVLGKVADVNPVIKR